MADAPKPIIETAAGLVLRAGGSEVLLVQQRRPFHPELRWELPGGLVEPGESLADAVMRELHEETGLVVTNAGNLLYTVEHERTGETQIDYVFEVGRWEGEVHPNDPDGEILDARFMSRDDALEVLRRVPWRPSHEPIVMYLSGDIPAGATWHYATGPDGVPHLISCELRGRTVLQDARVSARAGLLLISTLGVGIAATLWCLLGMLGGV